MHTELLNRTTSQVTLFANLFNILIWYVHFQRHAIYWPVLIISIAQGALCGCKHPPLSLIGRTNRSPQRPPLSLLSSS